MAESLTTTTTLGVTEATFGKWWFDEAAAVAIDMGVVAAALDDSCFVLDVGVDRNDNEPGDLQFPFNRLAMSSAAAALLLASLSGVDVAVAFLCIMVLVEVVFLLVEIGDEVVGAVDIWRCIELAAAAANRAARAFPPSAVLGEDGTAVGGAVIVNGASLMYLRDGLLSGKYIFELI